MEGNSFKKVLALDHVDFSKTVTVDIFEVMQVLGVEAARRTIINEITKTIKSHSLNVDRRHLILVADVLTSKGTEIIHLNTIYQYSRRFFEFYVIIMSLV